MIPTILMVMIFSFQGTYGRGGWTFYSTEFSHVSECERARHELQAVVTVASKELAYPSGSDVAYVKAWCSTK